MKKYAAILLSIMLFGCGGSGSSESNNEEVNKPKAEKIEDIEEAEKIEKDESIEELVAQNLGIDVGLLKKFCRNEVKPNSRSSDPINNEVLDLKCGFYDDSLEINLTSTVYNLFDISKVDYESQLVTKIVIDNDKIQSGIVDIQFEITSRLGVDSINQSSFTIVSNVNGNNEVFIFDTSEIDFDNEYASFKAFNGTNSYYEDITSTSISKMNDSYYTTLTARSNSGEMYEQELNRYFIGNISEIINQSYGF